MAGVKSRENGKKGGRPKGSTTKPRLSDYLTEEMVVGLVKKAHDMASTGDQTMLKFILEQHFGKAVQPLGGPDGKELPVPIFDLSGVLSNNSNKKNNSSE